MVQWLWVERADAGPSGGAAGRPRRPTRALKVYRGSDMKQGGAVEQSTNRETNGRVRGRKEQRFIYLLISDSDRSDYFHWVLQLLAVLSH